jgi:hypothetical protein
LLFVLFFKFVLCCSSLLFDVCFFPNRWKHFATCFTLYLQPVSALFAHSLIVCMRFLKAVFTLFTGCLQGVGTLFSRCFQTLCIH